jgi:hypothetical protein
MWSDMQAIAVWVVIVGVVGYLLFPSFFQNVYSVLTNPLAESTQINEISLPTSTNNEAASALTTMVYRMFYNSIMEKANLPMVIGWFLLPTENLNSCKCH